MNLNESKVQFDRLMPAGEDSAVVEMAWLAFKALFAHFPEGERCEEFAFSAGWAAHHDGFHPVEARSRFQVYFGRQLDLVESGGSRTVEINLYYRYQMTPDLQGWIDERRAFDLEDGICLDDGREVLGQKLTAFFEAVDRQQRLWEMLRELVPLTRDIQFYTW